MNCLVVLVAGLILSASPGNCLRCYSCIASQQRCVDTTVNCTRDTEQCYLGVAEVGSATVYQAGCILPGACNIQQSIGDLSVTIHCCNTDLCNASDQVKLSLLLFPALVSVWFAIFM